LFLCNADCLGAGIAIRAMFAAYENFVRSLAIRCGFHEKEFQLPIEVL